MGHTKTTFLYDHYDISCINVSICSFSYCALNALHFAYRRSHADNAIRTLFKHSPLSYAASLLNVFSRWSSQGRIEVRLDPVTAIISIRAPCEKLFALHKVCSRLAAYRLNSRQQIRRFYPSFGLKKWFALVSLSEANFYWNSVSRKQIEWLTIRKFHCHFYSFSMSGQAH